MMQPNVRAGAGSETRRLKTSRPTVLRSLVALGLAGTMSLGQVLPSVAHAQTAPAAGAADKPAAKPSPAEAKKQLTEGEKKFKAGSYTEALAAFQASDSIKPTPQTARYIGLTQDKLENYPEAVAGYERFLAEVPPKMDKEAEEARKRIEEIKALPGKVQLQTAPAGATVTLDGKALESVTPTEFEVAPGKHTLQVTAEGFVAQEKEIEVAFASAQSVTVELEAVPPPPPPPPPPIAEAPAPAPEPPPPPPQRSKLPAYITGGLAVAAAGVGTVFGILALNDKSDFDKNPTAAKADDGENHALIADMAFGVAITFGVTSAVLFLTKDEPAATAAAKAQDQVAKKTSPPAPPKVTVRPAPIITPHGGGAGALIRF